MELRQLKYFIKAAETSNFTEAANCLFISQSTLSQQLKQLEDELDILLFDRVAKRVRLTEAGSLFLPYARQTVRESEDGRHMLKDLKNLQTGKMTIGATYGLTTLLLSALADFSVLYPAIKINIIYGTSEELMEKLSAAQLDFVLSFVPVQKNKTYVSAVLFESVLSLVVHQSNPLAKEKFITLKQLGQIPLALPAVGYSIRNFLDEVLKNNQVLTNISIETNDINMLLLLAHSGKYSTVLMKTSLFSYPSLTAVPIGGKDMIRQATLTWPANAYRKKSAVVFTELLMKQADQLND